MFKRRYLLFGLIILIISFFALKIYFRKDVSLSDPVSIITCGILLLTLLYTALAFEIGEIKAKNTISFNISCEWHKPVMTNYLEVERSFLKDFQQIANHHNAQQFYDELEKVENVKAKTAISSIFNYFESISLGVNQGFLNEKFVKGFFQSLFKHYYIDYFFYIQYRRYRRNNDQIWINFTNLVGKWNKS